MKFRNILSHLTAALALAVVVILVIDLFFNSAMYLAAGREFKYLCLALGACALVCAQNEALFQAAVFLVV